MKIQYDLMDESNMDVEDLEAERTLQLAAVDAIRRARRFGTTYVIWEDERVKEVAPGETGPYEERLLASVGRLHQRIEVLKRAASSDLSLNDKPVQ
jgi:hypothetical protein